MKTTSKAIGIDFGGTTIKSAVVQGGQLVAHGEAIDTQLYTDAESLIGEILRTIATLRSTHPEVAAVGVGLPGFVDSVNGIVHELTNVAGWDEVPLRAILAERSGLPAIIENDAKAMAYGEWKYGAAQNGRHVLCVTLGTGVGGALILDGRLYRGAQLAAGEIGHASIDYRGVSGPYGDRGGLEEYVGNQQIADRAVECYRAVGREVAPEKCTPLDLQEAANSGDAVAIKLWEEIGTKVGAALASVVWLINPDTIVIGGGVAKAGELIFGPIRRTIAARTIELIHRDLRVIPAALGNDAGIIGCAILALEAAGLA